MKRKYYYYYTAKSGYKGLSGQFNSTSQLNSQVIRGLRQHVAKTLNINSLDIDSLRFSFLYSRRRV